MYFDQNKHYFFVTRGLPGSGKSSFIKEHYSDIANIIELDALRLKYAGLEKINDEFTISQSKNYSIIKIADKLLEDSLNKNNITILDSTCLKEKYINKQYKLANKLNCEFWVIDFSSVDVNICKNRNRLRLPKYKRVSDEIIDRMYLDLLKPIQNLNLMKHFISYLDI